MNKAFLTLAVMTVAIILGLTACNGDNIPWGLDDLGGTGQRGGGIGSGSGQIDSLPLEDLSAIEQDAILFMIEEEKLARDVYIKMYENWNLGIFNNISKSEQTHYNALLGLIEKYSLVNPVEGMDVGEFNNADLQELYYLLIDAGNQSLEDALLVGIEIEDLDIADLLRYIELIDNQDVTLVFNNLTMGSRNHLRAYYGNLQNYGIDYTPKHISQELFDEIVSSSNGRGRRR